MTNAADILDAAANTYRERNAVYGDNWRRISGAMAALFPDGLTVKTEDDWARLHFLLLTVVKQSRYANNFAKGGHQDSVRDMTVYGAMLEAYDDNILSLLSK